MPTIRTVCAHDCPDMCSLLAHVEDGRVVRIEGDPDQPFTAGFACGKVNRDTGSGALAGAPDHAAAPHRTRKARASSHRSPGMPRWTRSSRAGKAIIAESGPLALLGYAYSAHQGQMNRGLTNGLFHALGTSRLRGGTVCDTLRRGRLGRDRRRRSAAPIRNRSTHRT